MKLFIPIIFIFLITACQSIEVSNSGGTAELIPEESKCSRSKIDKECLY